MPMTKREQQARARRERELMRRLGATIRARRVERKMSLARLAALTHIDISWLSKVERGIGRTELVPGYIDIARALGWTPAAMLRAAFPDLEQGNGQHGGR